MTSRYRDLLDWLEDRVPVHARLRRRFAGERKLPPPSRALAFFLFLMAGGVASLSIWTQINSPRLPIWRQLHSLNLAVLMGLFGLAAAKPHLDRRLRYLMWSLIPLLVLALVRGFRSL